MNILKMNQYGKYLTGREFGQTVMKRIGKDIDYPVCLDFSEVVAVAASFADEVVVPVAKKQGGRVEVINVSKVVWTCLQVVAEDRNIEITKLSQ